MTSLVPYGESEEEDDEATPSKQSKSPKRSPKRKLEAFHESDEGLSKKKKVYTSLGISASNPIKGDWLCYCYVPLSDQADVSILMNQVYKFLITRDDQVALTSDRHISLTKPILIRFHEKDGLLAKAKEGVTDFVKASTSNNKERISLAFSTFTHLPSEDGSRIYWAIEIGLGWQELRSLTSSLDKKLSSFHAREYFKEARFHCSFAWQPSSQSREQQVIDTSKLLESTYGKRLRAFPAIFIDKIGIATGSQTHYVDLKSVK